MEDDLGKPLEQIFSSISERPIAAASLGQVRALDSMYIEGFLGPYSI